jgi:hypothetical protein
MVPAGVLAAWRKARGDLPPAIAQRRLLICYNLLSGLGDKIAPDDWQALYEGPIAGGAPQPAMSESAVSRGILWQGLRLATEDLRLGEVVMFSLATLSDAGLAQADPTDLYRVVAALHLIGLDANARALATEAAIANGL